MKDIELKKKLTELQENLQNIRFGSSGGKSKNVKEVMNTRRDVARILTILNLKKNGN